MTLPKASELVAGKVAKASSVLGNDQYLLDLINNSLNEARVQGCYVSKLIGDTVIPPSLLPKFGTADGIQLAHPLYSQAQHVQALDLDFRGRHPQDVMGDNDDPGRCSPAYGGFVVPDMTNDTVEFYTQTAIDGNWSKTVYQLNSGDTPTHCCALRNGKIYVACEGSYKIRVINTRTGVVSDFVDLTSYSTDFGNAATEFGQIVTNRQGTAIYMIAKVGTGGTATTNRSVVVRVTIPAGVITKMVLADDYDIANLAFIYPGGTSFADGVLLVARSTDAAATGHILKVAESAWSDGGTISTGYIIPAAGEMIDGMCEYGSGVAVVGHVGSTTNVRMRVLNWNEQYSSATALEQHIEQVDASGTPAPAILGSICTDGFAVYWAQSGATYGLRYWIPGRATHEGFNITSTGGPWNYPNGPCFTGDVIAFFANTGSPVPGREAVAAPIGF